MRRFTTVLFIFLLGACNLSQIEPVRDSSLSPAPTRTLSLEDVSATGESSNSSPTLNPALISTAEASEAACQPPNNWFTYTVQRGDTLTTIASRTNSTVDELIAANCLDNPNRIRVGDEILVPNEADEQP